MREQIKPAVIAISESLSGALGVGTRLITGIHMPADWTAANLTFAGSATYGGTYDPIYNSDGNELTVSADADRFIALTVEETEQLSAAPFIKVRSGTLGSAVTQAAARTLQLVFK